jgi:hypothetical protein
MNDTRLAELAARPTSVDAASWIDQARTGQAITLGEWTQARSLAFLTRLVQAHPRRVLALDPEHDPTLGVGTSTLVVELPDAPGSRAQIFALEGEVAGAGGFDGEADVGQHYLMLHW